MLFVLGRDGRIQYHSTSTQRALGHLPDSLLGKEMLSLVHPDELAGIAACVKRRIEHGISHLIVFYCDGFGMR